jgi:outer membrane immunogenic protein
MPECKPRILIELAIALGALSAVSPIPSWAETKIGAASSASNQVTGTVGSESRPLAAGSDVFQDELVRTGDASVAQLVFLDDTNLSVGPKSQVKLDRFVYNADRNAGTVVVRASQGIFRFVTGSQPSQNYTVETPLATIGVRGTAFDLLVRPDKVVIIVVSGEVRVRTRTNRVVVLSQPNDSVTIFASGRIVGPVQWTSPITDVASNVQFPYFGTLQAAILPFIPTGVPVGPNPWPGTDPWTGAYVGGNIGYSWGRLDNSTTVAPFTADPGLIDMIFGGGGSSAQVKPNGVIGGGQIGYNWRLAPRWLAGIEADFQASGQKGTTRGLFSGITTDCSFNTCVFTNTTDITAKLSWFGTARGRAGMEQNGLWFYGTGGLAYGKVSVSGTNTFSVTATPGPVTVVYSTPFSYSKTKWGWVAGAGIEGRFGVSKWTWKIEYLHMDLGSIGGGSFGGLPVVALNSSKFTDEIVRFGINYKISP